MNNPAMHFRKRDIQFSDWLYFFLKKCDFYPSFANHNKRTSEKNE